MSVSGRLRFVGGCALAYLALAALIAVHATDRLDDAAARLFWRGPEWGPTQAHDDRIVALASPAHVTALVLLVAVVIGVVRRSALPLVAVVVVGLPVALAELGTKWLLPRLTVDPTPQHFGGTYPSGHVVTVVALVGALLLGMPGRGPWWRWLVVVLLGAAMGVAVQVDAIHRLTDVIGSGLLSTGALVTGSVLRDEVAGRRRRGRREVAAPVGRG